MPLTDLKITREDLARVCWPRLLDRAPLTLDERKVIARFQGLVTSVDDDLARAFRQRCLTDLAQELLKEQVVPPRSRRRWWWPL